MDISKIVPSEFKVKSFKSGSMINYFDFFFFLEEEQEGYYFYIFHEKDNKHLRYNLRVTSEKQKLVLKSAYIYLDKNFEAIINIQIIGFAQDHQALHQFEYIKLKTRLSNLTEFRDSKDFQPIKLLKFDSSALSVCIDTYDSFCKRHYICDAVSMIYPINYIFT